MEERLAFTARYWAESGVVCRAIENRPGLIVDQQFGVFETWTEAHAFAKRLNEGLGLTPSQAQQIIVAAILASDSLLQEFHAPDSQCSCDTLANRPRVMTSRINFVIAQLDLAMTFCRMLRSRPNSPQTGRMMRNSRNAFFNTLHFALSSGLCNCCLDRINPKLQKLQAALRCQSNTNRNTFE